jgi:hypothetical protein
MPGSSQVPLPSSVERRAHAPPVARARIAHRLKVVVTENHQSKAATGGCVTRLVLRCIDSIWLTRSQKRINRLRFMLARCRPWSEFGANHDSMTILNCHHSTRNPLLKSMPKCPNTYQSLDAVALNPGGRLQVTASNEIRSRQYAVLTIQQRISAPYRAIHEKGPWWKSESPVRLISCSSSFFRRTMSARTDSSEGAG